MSDLGSTHPKGRDQKTVSIDAAATPSCCVCGAKDSRALTTTELRAGASVVVCANHELMHRRAGGAARSIVELRATFAERRDRKRDRRGAFALDELSAQLTHAFAGERRSTARRA